MTTPSDLAEELGVPEREVRRVLRSLFPDADVEEGQPWDLSPEIAANVRQHLGGGTSGGGSVTA